MDLKFYVIIIAIFIAAIFLIFKRKNSTIHRLDADQEQDSPFQIDEYKDNEEIRKLISENKKIQAIKKFRELNPHLSLHDAVQYVDDYIREMKKTDKRTD